jgi:two-component system, NtrC family, sensor kinase
VTVPRPRRSLRAELLVNLGLVTSAAVLIVGVTTTLVAEGSLDELRWHLLTLWGATTSVFVLFGAYVLQERVIAPLRQLQDEADALAAGDLEPGARQYEAEELHELAERYRLMARNLLDVQSQIVRVEKLAGIGSLAAGVAHEVRNPLGAVGTYLDVLRRRGADPDVTAAMRGAIERIERTVESLLAYAKPGAGPGVADVNEAVQASLDFLGAQGLLSDGTVTVELGERLPPVHGHQHGLEQVVVNLVMNARQAAPRGVLAVGTELRRYGESHREASRRGERGIAAEGAVPERERRWGVRPRRTDVAPGTDGVLLYVADDGPGVPEEHRGRVFDPFFTTKPPGEGTGLGLAIVARTVHEAGGTVWVDRSREGGAVFKVFLPAAGVEQERTTLEPMHAAAHR